MRYICTMCGYIYYESKGLPSQGIASGTKFQDVPGNFICPSCRAPVLAFRQAPAAAPSITSAPFLYGEANSAEQSPDSSPVSPHAYTRAKPATRSRPAGKKAAGNSGAEALTEIKEKHTYNYSFTDGTHFGADVRGLSAGEISVICSGLAGSLTIQHLSEKADALEKLAEHFKAKAIAEIKKAPPKNSEMLNEDLTSGFPSAVANANAASDRGALRSLEWCEKVSGINYGLLKRFAGEDDVMLEDTNIFVCGICGCIHLGDAPLEDCPVCNAPGHKMREIERR